MARTTQRAVQELAGKTYIGIDNGVSGSIGIVPFSGVHPRFHRTPVFNCLSYNKEEKHMNRIDVVKLSQILLPYKSQSPFAILERPMVNPKRFNASTSALRALEATLITLEQMQIPYQFVDSKEWQKIMLPKGTKGSDDLKKASLDVGKRLFPQFAHLFKGDADGIIIAEWARRVRL